MSDRKLFGQYNEFVLLIVGILLTGIVGGSITHYFQTQSDETARRNLAAQADIDRTTSLMAEYSEDTMQAALKSGNLLSLMFTEDSKPRSKFTRTNHFTVEGYKDYLDSENRLIGLVMRNDKIIQIEFGAPIEDAAVQLITDELELKNMFDEYMRGGPFDIQKSQQFFFDDFYVKQYLFNAMYEVHSCKTRIRDLAQYGKLCLATRKYDHVHNPVGHSR